MNPILKTLSVVAITLLLSACGKNEEVNTVSLKYSFEENGCKTGEHTATSEADYCSNLRNEGLNGGCAYNTRKSTFEARGCGVW